MECALWRAGEVAGWVLLDGQVNQNLTTEFFNVNVIGDSNKNFFHWRGRGKNLIRTSSRQEGFGDIKYIINLSRTFI